MTLNESIEQPKQTKREKRSDKEIPPIYAFDFETDPFKEWETVEEQRVPEVFAVGVLGPEDIYEECWGTQQECIDFLESCFEAAPRGSIFYAHNGGRYDFHMFKHLMRGKLQMIGPRITEAQVGHVYLRDSFSLLPEALKKFPFGEQSKLDIDYSLMEPGIREKHKTEILAYMKRDCVVLRRGVIAFIEEFGISLTVASASMREFKKFHEYERLNPKQDEMFRGFFYGGRVECFEKGVIHGDFKVYDVNNMYGSVMRNFEHPISQSYVTYGGKFKAKALDQCDFAEIECRNDGAFPTRIENGSLIFNKETGIFRVTGHEIRAALECNLINIKQILSVYRAAERCKFDTFIDHFHGLRLKAKADGNQLGNMFYKLVINSSYGKFAQDPSRFRDHILTHEVMNTSEGWRQEWEFPNSNPPLFIWSQLSKRPKTFSLFNVMTAASITGAARAQLLRGLHKAKRPIYCDTDSIIAEALDCDQDATRLGAWKTEAEGSRVGIAGKKLYALFDASGSPVKSASKGVNLTPEQIMEVANGGEVTYRNAAPTFSISAEPKFIERIVRRT